MRSPINWALLGLVIEAPSHAYDLARRFESRYGQTLPLSDVRQIYTGLRALSARSLIEQSPNTPKTPSAGRPAPQYRATTRGQRAYGTWLVSQADEDRRQFELFILALRAFAREPQELLEIVSRWEELWLQEGIETPIARGDSSPDPAARLLEHLGAEEHRLAVGAKLAWLRYAREQIEEFASGREPRGQP
jgi:DNA-binding PadR family transcriptional regulator